MEAIPTLRYIRASRRVIIEHNIVTPFLIQS
ncbi:hypothetical protein EPYR_03573 [Erwinia pyrifoliae DSM 12163]|nr:hypothetical protein EPYR_03573 [Erwinia pyrifoliae DSM 12163]